MKYCLILSTKMTAVKTDEIIRGRNYFFLKASRYFKKSSVPVSNKVLFSEITFEEGGHGLQKESACQ